MIVDHDHAFVFYLQLLCFCFVFWHRQTASFTTPCGFVELVNEPINSIGNKMSNFTDTCGN